MIFSLYGKPGLYSHKISKFCVFFFFLSICSACGEGPPDHIGPIDKRFRTTPPSRIYFKNIRTSAYQWQQSSDSRTEYYLLRKLAASNPLPVLYPYIADVWMEDQAHLLFKSGRFETLQPPISVHWQGAAGEKGTFGLDTLNTLQQYEMAMAIYQACKKGYRLEIEWADKEKQALFRDSKEQDLFLISMQDYLRLTEYF